MIFFLNNKYFLLLFSFIFVSCHGSNAHLRIYVSSSTGDDNNTGLSPKVPVKTIRIAQTLGDTILLKGGDVFHEYLILKNKHLSRYGFGKDPEICGLRKLQGTPWVNEAGNIWRVNLTEAESTGFVVKGTSDLNNVGCFYENDKDVIHGRRLYSKEGLNNNWDFYQADINGYNVNKSVCFDFLYLYYEGNPNDLDLSISIGSHYGITLYDSSVEHLKIKGFGTGGVNLFGKSNVLDCQVDVIGGSLMLHGKTSVCLGNGIDFWVSQDAYDCFIANNIITRCYDCGCSIQAYGHGQATPRNIVFKNNYISNCCQGWEDFLRNDDNVMYENCIFEDNIVVNIGETTGFGYADGRFKYCHVLGNNTKGDKGMIIRNNIFVGGNYYCSGAYKGKYKSNVWQGNTCIITPGNFILSNYNGSKDVIRIPIEKGKFTSLAAATKDAIQRYRELTGDETTHFVIKNNKQITRLIKKLRKKYFTR